MYFQDTTGRVLYNIQKYVVDLTLVNKFPSSGVPHNPDAIAPEKRFPLLVFIYPFLGRRGRSAASIKLTYIIAPLADIKTP